jgi:hypothetical protein
VSGSDVYLSGQYSTSASASSYTYGYWKNGTWQAPAELNVLSTMPNIGVFITVSGGSVYIVGGSVAMEYKNKAYYWKNGKIIVLGEIVTPVDSGNIAGIAIGE